MPQNPPQRPPRELLADIFYVRRDPPGNTVTAEWNPDAPAVVHVEVLRFGLGKYTFNQFVRNVHQFGLTHKTEAGFYLWIPPHNIERVEEVPNIA